jgi:hypothetical protein
LPRLPTGRIVVSMRPRPVVLIVLLVSGCATASGGFTDERFVGRNGGYSVDYAYGGSSDKNAKWLLAPVDWELENYFVNTKGRPYREMREGIYVGAMAWPDVGGGTVDVEYTIHDLKLRHGNGSILTVCTVAVPAHLHNLHLSTVAEQWANSYSGLQFSFGRGEGRRTASKIVESKARKVGGQPAREVTFDVVDADQLQLDANAPRTRVRAVFIHADLTKEFLSPPTSAPAFLFVAYVSDEKKFDRLVGDYEGLLARIHFDKP